MTSQTDIYDKLRNKLRERLTIEKRAALRQRYAEPLALFYGSNLRRLAQIYGSDKWSDHWYCQYYEKHFAPLRRKKINLLEIGIGGYDDPKAGGRSLRMWRKYFSRGKITGIDIADKSPHDERRIQTFKGDQTDEAFLRNVINKIGTPDIIIDDGSHLNAHVLKTFQVLFPLLADNGIYVVEDTQTAYWPSYGGNSIDLDTGLTSMSMLKGLVDGLNFIDYLRPGYEPTYYDKHIVSMHFYHNLVFIFKGLNDEPATHMKPGLD